MGLCDDAICCTDVLLVIDEVKIGVIFGISKRGNGKTAFIAMFVVLPELKGAGKRNAPFRDLSGFVAGRDDCLFVLSG